MKLFNTGLVQKLLLVLFLLFVMLTKIHKLMFLLLMSWYTVSTSINPSITALQTMRRFLESRDNTFTMSGMQN